MPSACTPPQHPAIPDPRPEAAELVEMPLAGRCVVRALLWKAGGLGSREKAVSRKCHSLKCVLILKAIKGPRQRLGFQVAAPSDVKAGPGGRLCTAPHTLHPTLAL